MEMMSFLFFFQQMQSLVQTSTTTNAIKIDPEHRSYIIQTESGIQIANNSTIYQSTKEIHKTPYPILSATQIHPETVVAYNNEIHILDSNNSTHACSIDYLESMEYSPDMELVVVSTSDYKILLLTFEFDLVVEIDLRNPPTAEYNAQALGWGSKSTQFHGSAGKAAATAGETVNEIEKEDQGGKHISWRPDGNYFR